MKQGRCNKKGSRGIFNKLLGDSKPKKEETSSYFDNDFPREWLDMSKPLNEIKVTTKIEVPNDNKASYHNEQFSSVYVTSFKEDSKGNVGFLKENHIDVDHGLELLGDLDMYNETLNDFINGINERMSKLKSFKDQSDMGNYAIEVHALKSDSKYLGFTKMADLAYQQELESKNNNNEFIINNYEVLNKEATRIINLVKQYLGK